MAFIALDEDTGHMLRLVRLKDELDEKTAEFAILVRSRFKGHGLGWLLMQRVIDYAKKKRSAARVWRRVGRKHSHAANVHRARFLRAGHGTRHQARRARSRKCRRLVWRVRRTPQFFRAVGQTGAVHKQPDDKRVV